MFTPSSMTAHLIAGQFSDNQNRDSSSWLCPRPYLNYWIRDQGDPRGKNDDANSWSGKNSWSTMPEILFSSFSDRHFKTSLSWCLSFWNQYCPFDIYLYHIMIFSSAWYHRAHIYLHCNIKTYRPCAGVVGMDTQVRGKRSSRSLGLTRCCDDTRWYTRRYDDTWSSNGWRMMLLMIQYDTSCLHIADVVIRFKTKVNTQMDVQCSWSYDETFVI